jgi:hypothetical protein
MISMSSVIVRRIFLMNARFNVKRIAPGMSMGSSGGLKVDERARCSAERGVLWLPGTIYRHESVYKALVLFSMFE